MLMENAGLTFDSIPAQIDERAIELPLEQQGEPPENIAKALALAKALDVSSRYPDALVLGSDQTMSLGSRSFHKPRTMDEARDHLLSLSGATHQLNSAVVFVQNGSAVWDHVSSARLTVRQLSSDFVDRHLSRVGQAALQSVGAYQLEGEGVQLFSKIDGDYFTILGLPLLQVLEQLRTMGALDA
jgi:septum formation protein